MTGTCQKCGTWRKSLHREHKTPKFKGGTESPDNIWYICANCHEDKTREDLIGRPVIVTEATKEKIRITLKGRTTSLLGLERARLARLGSKASVDTRQKISQTRKERMATPEARQRASEAAKRTWAKRSEEDRRSAGERMRAAITHPTSKDPL